MIQIAMGHNSLPESEIHNSRSVYPYLLLEITAPVEISPDLDLAKIQEIMS